MRYTAMKHRIYVILPRNIVYMHYITMKHRTYMLYYTIHCIYALYCHETSYIMRYTTTEHCILALYCHEIHICAILQ